MPNLSQAFKAEIVRLSRKEIKSSAILIYRTSIVLKRNVADLKKRIAVFESEKKRFIAIQKEFQEPKSDAQNAQVKDNKVRITSRTIKALRAKLCISQELFGKLLGVSSQAVYVMERKSGRLRLRSQTLANLLSLRGIGKREVAERLEKIKAKSKKIGVKGKKK
jgi:DNA-binding transcriptional regulator YiaG